MKLFKGLVLVSLAQGAPVEEDRQGVQRSERQGVEEGIFSDVSDKKKSLFSTLG